MFISQPLYQLPQDLRKRRTRHTFFSLHLRIVKAGAVKSEGNAKIYCDHHEVVNQRKQILVKVFRSISWFSLRVICSSA